MAFTKIKFLVKIFNTSPLCSASMAAAAARRTLCGVAYRPRSLLLASKSLVPLRRIVDQDCQKRKETSNLDVEKRKMA